MPDSARSDDPVWSPQRWMTVRYATALLLIAMFAVGAFVMTEGVLTSHSNMVDVVNSSGRQRMLSQRAALLVERLANAEPGSDQSELIAKLKETITLFATTHQRLTTELSASHRRQDAQIREIRALDQSVNSYIRLLHSVLQTAASPDGVNRADADEVISMALGPLLPQLEERVARYQESGEQGIATLHQLGQLALILTLLTLGAEALLIFHPMVRQVHHQFAQIRRITAALRESNESLEQQVIQRTRELMDAKVAAEHANHAKSRFLAHASHDLKQPLEAIGMFTGILERQVGNARGIELIRDLRAAQRSMRALLNAVLELSRLESGVVQARLMPVQLQPLFDQLLAEFTPAAEDRGLSLRQVKSSAWVMADPLLLERIVRNLLANAIRYTETGGVVFGCRHHNGNGHSSSRLSIAVCDTGPGIAPEDCQRIFEEFVQLDRKDRDRSEGIGLGLAIVERLARLMDQRLTLKSHVGKGTCFALTVSLVQPVPDAGIVQPDNGKVGGVTGAPVPLA